MKKYEKTTWKPTSNLEWAKEAVDNFEHYNMRSIGAFDKCSNDCKTWWENMANSQQFHKILWKTIWASTKKYSSTKREVNIND